MLRNSAAGWGLVARNLHWLMAGLIFGQVILGKYASELDRSPEKLGLMMWHKSIGITLLFLVLLRLGWALANRRPEAPAGTGSWQHRAAWVSHAMLYALMVAIPLSGWLHNSAENIPFSLFRAVTWPSLIGPSEKLAPIFEEVHETLVAVLLSLVAVHVSAALWHHFIRRDDVLRRMLKSSAEP